MWEWFATNSVWLFFGAAFVLVLLLSVGNRIRDKIMKAAPEAQQPRIERGLTVTFRALEGITLLIIAFAFVAIVQSEEGIFSIITPKTIQQWLLEHGTRILIILLMGVALWYAVKRFTPLLVQHAMARPIKGESKQGVKKRADTLTGVFIGVGKVLVIITIAFMFLSELKIPIGPILAGFGIVGLAVGFGAQYLIRDLIAGVFILLENQYRVGDVARVAEISGLVEAVNLRKTVLRDLDGIVHHVPNGEIKVASNFTRHFSRVNLNISVAYGTDLDHAISVINRVGQELAKDPKWADRIINAPQVLRVDNLGDSGIELKILGDVKPIEQWNVMGELRLRIKKAFDAEGIEIPWPHVKLYFGDKWLSKSLICPACSQPNYQGNKFCANCGAKLPSQ